jgi:hypothetical protein
MRRGEVLLEDEAKAASLSCQHDKKVRHVETSVRGEVTPGRGKGGDKASCDDANLTEPINKENSRD